MIEVNVRLEPSFDENGLDEVYVTANDPYINFAIRVPKKISKDLGSGLYTLSLTPKDIKKTKAAE